MVYLKEKKHGTQELKACMYLANLYKYKPGGRMRCKTLDEERHEDDEAHAHEQDSVPVGLKHKPCPTRIMF